jgi:hypothetical protein
MTNRAALFQKSTRKNTEFERYLCDGQEPAVLDATTSKYIPLSYFVTPHTQAAAAPAAPAAPAAQGARAQLRHAAAARRARLAVIAAGLKPAATCAKGPSSWAFWDGRPTKVGLSQRLPQASA